MQRFFQYTEQGDGGDPITVRVTDEEILRDYFPGWSEQMRQAGKADDISPEHCIEDFVVVHWAVEVEAE